MITNVKKISELDFDSVDFDSGGWGWSFRGGLIAEDGLFSILTIDDDGNEIRYDIPKCICEILMKQYDDGRMDAKRKICEALGV